MAKVETNRRLKRKSSRCIYLCFAFNESCISRWLKHKSSAHFTEMFNPFKLITLAPANACKLMVRHALSLSPVAETPGTIKNTLSVIAYDLSQRSAHVTNDSLRISAPVIPPLNTRVQTHTHGTQMSRWTTNLDIRQSNLPPYFSSKHSIILYEILQPAIFFIFLSSFQKEKNSF